ncbi:MAG: hypothetical protein ABIQ16_06075, partial [Polyangiaceae bacterium]
TMERIDLGTTSDLIADEGTQCPVLFDLQNKVSGVAQPGQTCDFTTTAGTYHLEISTFTFVIASNHETALSHLTGVTSLTTNGVTATCNSEQSLNYTR